MPPRIVVVGGGAAGIGAAGSARQVDPDARITVYTEYEDAAYSPCGIPYVHGREIPDFQSLFLQGKEAYRQAGIDIHYERRVTGLDLGDRLVHVDGEASVPFDRLVVASGFEYADPGVPGTDLEGLYYVKNIRRAIEWDKVLDDVRVAVVLDASPLGLEMVTALAHRGIETHVVDAHPWALAEVADPDIMQPVEESWAELGVKTHFNTRVEALVGDGTYTGR
jgi:NADH oxidase (H2O2-forming)